VSAAAELPRARRILILAPFPPSLTGRHGGARAIAHFVAGLAERHDVALLYLRAPGDGEPDEPLRRACAFVEEVPHPSRRLRVPRLLARLLAGEPLWVADWHVATAAEAVQALTERWRPDIVQAEYHVMAQYLRPKLGGPPTVVTIHEPGTRTSEARAASGAPWAIAAAALDLRAWRRYDRDVVGAADAVLVFSEEDRRSLLSTVGTRPRVVRIQRGTDVPSEWLATPPVHSSTILFAGSYRHPPNVHAAKRLATSIMPRVRRRHPDARLQLVGERPPRAVRRLAGDAVLVTGWVPDLRPWLDEAAVVAVPLTLGGGVRLKVLEALAAAKAVVASPEAAAGLDVADGRDLVLARSDEDFASAIAALLGASARRRALEEGARRWAEAQPGWGDTLAQLERVHDAVIAEDRDPPEVPAPSSG
jgi:polysaccharide biosynthesis protein PslH